MNFFTLLLTMLILSACTTSGPSPTDQQYNKAILSLPEANNAVIIVTGEWLANTILGSVSSFGAASNAKMGKLFLSENSLVFAQYDPKTITFLKSYEIKFSEIGWLSTKEHGIARIIRLQAREETHSFLFKSAINPLGEKISKDEVLVFIESKVN